MPTPDKKTAHQSANDGSYLGSFWMVGACFCFTIMGVVIKQASIKFGLHEYELVFWRVSFALLVLGGQAYFLKQSLKTQHLQSHFARSFSGTISLFMFFYGITHLPLATAVTFSNTSTLFLAVLSVILLKQSPNRQVWLALIMGFVGVAMILQPTLLNHGILPSLIGLGSGLVAGYAYLQVRELSKAGEPSWRIVFYFSLVATVLSAIMSTIKGWTAINSEILPYLLVIGISAMAGQLMMTYAYQVGKKFMVASLNYLVVVLSTLYGVFMFNEILNTLMIVGICLVISSGVIGGYEKKK